MAEPSYLYCGLDAETRRLAEELQELGGGDAVLDKMDVHAIVDDRLVSGDMQVVWAYGKTLGLRNALLPRSHPEAETMSYTTVTSTQRLSDMLRHQTALSPLPLVESVANWVLGGFNACVIAYGAKASGKTMSLFGPSPPSSSSSSVSPGYPTSLPSCYTASLLQQLYAEAQHMAHSQSGILTIGISAWVLRGSSIVDLCTPTTASAPLLPLEFAVIECPDYDTASRVIATCRSRAPGVLAIPADRPQPLYSQKAHFFLRIVVHKDTSPQARGASGHALAPALPSLSSSFVAASLRGSLESQLGASIEGLGTGPRGAGTSLAHIHIVDLVGVSSKPGPSEVQGKGQSHFREWREQQRPTAAGDDSHLSETERIAKRETLLQLQTFSKMLGEITALAASAAAAASAGTDVRDLPVPKRTCARESKLTTILAPIMQGNCKTFLFAYLRDGEDQYKRTRPLVGHLQGLSQVAVPCHCVRGIALHDLGMVSAYSVLAPYVMSTAAAGGGGRYETMADHRIEDFFGADKEDELEAEDGLDLLKIAAGDWTGAIGAGAGAGRVVGAGRSSSSSSSSSANNPARLSGAARPGPGHVPIQAQRVDSAIGQFHSMLEQVSKQPSLVLPAPPGSGSGSAARTNATSTPTPAHYPLMPQVPSSSSVRGGAAGGSKNALLGPTPSASEPTLLRATPALAPAHPTTTASSSSSSSFTSQPPAQAQPKPTQASPQIPSIAASVDEPHEDAKKAQDSHHAKHVYSVIESLGRLRNSSSGPGSDAGTGTPLKPALSPLRGAASRGAGVGVSWDPALPGSRTSPDGRSPSSSFGDQDQNQSLDSIITGSADDSYLHRQGQQQQPGTYIGSPAAAEAAAFFGLAAGEGQRPGQEQQRGHNPEEALAPLDFRHKSVPEVADVFAELLSGSGSGSGSDVGAGAVAGGDEESKSDPLGMSFSRFSDYGSPGGGSPALSTTTTQRGHSQHMQLRRNLAALLEALNEERVRRTALDRTLATTRDEALERATQYELAIDNLRLEERRIKAQLKVVLENASLQDVALVYEEQVTRLCNETEELRRRNLVLEERVLQQLEEGGRGSRGGAPLATGRGLVFVGDGHGPASLPFGAGGAMRRSTGSLGGVLGMAAVLGREGGAFTDDAISGGGAGNTMLRASHPAPSSALYSGDQSETSLAMGAAEQALFQASLRGAHASSKLRRLANDNAALRSTIEDLRKRERQALIQEKLQEQNARKLKAAHAECARLQTRLVECTEALNRRKQDLAVLTQEHSLVTTSERQLRSERARVQSELTLYRERVREMDEERRKNFKVVQATGALADAAFRRSAAAEGVGNSNAGSGTQQESGGMFQGTGLLTGSGAAPYLRGEELMLHSGSEELEHCLAELQEELLHSHPALLPLLRKCGEEIHDERVKFLAVQARLLAMLGSTAAHSHPLSVHGPSAFTGVGAGRAAAPVAMSGNMIDPGPAWPPRPIRKRESSRKPAAPSEEPKPFVF